MSVRSKEEILESIKNAIGEDNEALIPIIEDVSDTIDDYDARTSDSENWKQRYEENDKMWKQKYTDRFFNNDKVDEPNNDTASEDENDDDNAPKTFDDLFTTE